MSDQFRRDLQAWTEAKVRALLRRHIRVRTRQKPLIDNINALLTDRIASALEYLRGKSLPSEFLQTGNRDQLVTPVVSAVIDHGWLFSEIIYVWTTLKSLLAGKGWSFGASDEYATQVDQDDNLSVLYPEDWSGLTRLLVQSLLGNGRDSNDILPTGWGWEEGRIGCVRSPQGVYWLVRAKQVQGVTMSRLVIPDALSQMVYDLNDGLYSGDDALFVEATILGFAELPSTQDTVTCIDGDNADWTNLYADQWEECPWRWCFRYQKRGEDDEDLCGAVCVFHESTETTWPQRTVEWREVVLNISFNETGRPSASVSVEEQGWFQPVKHNFYTLKRDIPPSGITQNYLQLYLGDTAEISVVDTSSPLSEWGVIASCYGHDGQIQRVELIGRNKSTSSTSGNGPGLPDNYTVCKSGSYQDNENIEVAALWFAENTIDNIALRGSLRDESGTWSIQCPNATGGGNRTIIANNSANNAVLCGPGMVLLVGEIIPRTVVTSWSLSAGEDDFSCFCDGTDYGITSAMTWGQAVLYGDYTETEQITALANGLAVLNHDTRTTFGDSHAAYTWIKDILDDADTEPGAVVVVNYDSLAQSYGGQINIAGAIYTAGLNATGAELDGRFCGGV